MVRSMPAEFLFFSVCFVSIIPAACWHHTTAASLSLHADRRVMHLKSAWQKSMHVETEECVADTKKERQKM